MTFPIVSHSISAVSITMWIPASWPQTFQWSNLLITDWLLGQGYLFFNTILLYTCTCILYTIFMNIKKSSIFLPEIVTNENNIVFKYFSCTCINNLPLIWKMCTHAVSQIHTYIHDIYHCNCVCADKIFVFVFVYISFWWKRYLSLLHSLICWIEYK